jgi:low temperature requirement protein LtrA
VSESEREHERDVEHQVTPLELFFDLVFVFAMTQVTSRLADDPTWGGVLRGMLVLAALWWAWAAYAWLTSAMDVDEGGVRLTMLASTGAMLIVALAVPGGAALYLLALVAFLFRTTGRVFRRRTIEAVALLALVPATLALPALAALGLVSAVCSLVVAYEAIRYREHRIQVRHHQVAA